MMGSEDSPKDGGAVAGAVFGAVFIYIVRTIRFLFWRRLLLTMVSGILRVLWIPSLPPLQRKPPGRDKPVVITHPLLYTYANKNTFYTAAWSASFHQLGGDPTLCEAVVLGTFVPLTLEYGVDWHDYHLWH